MRKRIKVFTGAFIFISLSAISASSYSARTFSETLIMDNDAPSGANYTNPTSTNEHWIYYPKYGYGMNDYLTGSSYYFHNDARGGRCRQSTYSGGYVTGRTAYVWKWTGQDNTVPGSTIVVTAKLYDKRFTATEVDYFNYDENNLSYGSLYLGTINQDTWTGSVTFPARTLNSPRRGPYVIAVDASYNGYTRNEYMGADQIIFKHTKYISSK